MALFKTSPRQVLRDLPLKASVETWQRMERRHLPTETQKPVPVRPSRWLSDIKARLGRCITFGLGNEQIDVAAKIARTVGEQWKGLIVGNEGFVLRDGLEAPVRWGEMVSHPQIDPHGKYAWMIANGRRSKHERE